jgi:hypothetical protein
MPPESQRAFDPTAYLTEHQGRKYLEVKWRVLWLRTEHPDAVIETEEVASGEDWVKFRSRVTIPGGGSATGHAYQSKQDVPSGWYEKGETRSLGRALVCLGYGTQFATEFDDDTASVPNPVEGPIEFPRPRPVRASTPTRPEPPAPTRGRGGVTWNDFWLAVRDHKGSHPGFEESAIVGKDPSKRMTAEEAMRRFREATQV